MIDTDKYEGHKPAPWVWDINGVGQYESLRCNELEDYNETKRRIASKVDAYDVPTAELIADAPLLLAEVKRLRVIEERYRRMGNVLTSRDEEIELWMDNFEVTSQDVGDLEQQYEDLLRQKTEEMIRESEGLDWKSIAYMTSRLKVEMGYTCASSIEGYGDDE
jgi:hypothetical protein